MYGVLTSEDMHLTQALSSIIQIPLPLSEIKEKLHELLESWIENCMTVKREEGLVNVKDTLRRDHLKL